MTTTPYLSVVIPAYNEATNIRRNLATVVEFLGGKDYPSEVLVVDDGSTDETAKIVEEFFGGVGSVTLIRNPHRGKGYTVRTGVLKSQGEFVLFLDADLSTPIAEVDRFLMWLKDHDFAVAIASRQGFGARRVAEPWWRHFLGRGFNFGVQLMVLPGIEDSQCGFKLFKGDAARRIFSLLQTYGEGAPAVKKAYLGAFDVEVLFVARKLGYKIKEVPITWTYAQTQRLRPLTDALKMAGDVLKVRFNDWRGLYREG